LAKAAAGREGVQKWLKRYKHFKSVKKEFLLKNVTQHFYAHEWL
jgi:hypothetical protein